MAAIGCDDRDFLDAAHVADLPVALRAFRMRVVATDAGRPHDDGDDQPDLIAERRTRGVDQLLVGIVAQALQRRLFEIIERVRRTVLERKVGHEAIGDVLLLLADDLAEFERQGCRNGNSARNGLVIVDDLGIAGMRQDPADHVGGVIGADAGDDRVEVAGLPSQRGLGEIFQVEPHHERQGRQQQCDQKSRHPG